ncbi:SRPBCC family protein [Streptosporangium sp. G11]|uniref:SRPBCC family protein n=1 Tax=Streptosporangium sp. G11 TaxID=3436926 RepID=UPI003EBC7CD9
MIDIIAQINAVNREVGSRSAGDGEGIGVLLRRRYDAPIQDVWEALTDPDRMKRWFLPVSGDLRAGGDFQLEGNAGGRILRCEPPGLLKVTFGAESSLVELRLSPDGEDATIFELEHTVPLEMAGSGAGALYVGPGWDGAVMALGLFVTGEVADDPVAAANSPEGQEFSRRSVHAWIEAIEASGTAGAAEIAAAAEVSLAQFAPDAGSTAEGSGNA